jgi:hypothetical protein
MKMALGYKYGDVKNETFQATGLRITINRTLGSKTRKDIKLGFYNGVASPALQ